LFALGLIEVKERLLQIKRMTISYRAIFLLALLMPVASHAQVNGLERSYAERVAMRAIDARCQLFERGPRRALAGFSAQARGAALRSGSSTQRMDMIAEQAKTAAAAKPCHDPSVQIEVQRIIAAHKGWRAQLTGNYPGLARSWRVDRGGKDIWRAVQDTGSATRAGLITSATGLSFAVETADVDTSGARLFLRDLSKLGPPQPSPTLTPPLRNGTTIHVASSRHPAATRARLEQEPRAGTLFIFSEATTRAVLNADPRDTFEIEITSRSGAVTTLLVEVGDLVAAFTFAAEF
jgi:hypothetical protein